MFGRFTFFAIAIGVVVGLTAPSHNRIDFASAPAPPPRTITTEHGTSAVIIERSPSGHFFTTAMVNGQSVRFVVDTGASSVALTKADAQRIGLVFSPSDFEVVARGASGPVRGEKVTLNSVTVGDKEITGVSGMVLDDGLDVSLLGQSFLERIASVRITGDEMVLD